MGLNSPNQFAPFPPLTGLEAVSNSPPDMSVLVNIGAIATNNFVLGTVGSPGPGVVQVPLTAPGSNSQWAVVYWDQTLNVPGVTYSAAAASPTVQLPDLISQIPLCCILLNSLTTAILPVMILGMQNPAVFPCRPLLTGSNLGNTSFNCAGLTELVFSFALGGNATLTFTNLRIGVPTIGRIRNGSAGAVTLKLAASTPSGTSYTVTAKAAGVVAVDMVGTGFSITTALPDIAIAGATTTRYDSAAKDWWISMQT